MRNISLRARPTNTLTYPWPRTIPCQLRSPKDIIKSQDNYLLGKKRKKSRKRAKTNPRLVRRVSGPPSLSSFKLSVWSSYQNCQNKSTTPEACFGYPFLEFILPLTNSVKASRWRRTYQKILFWGTKSACRFFPRTGAYRRILQHVSRSSRWSSSICGFCKPSHHFSTFWKFTF